MAAKKTTAERLGWSVEETYARLNAAIAKESKVALEEWALRVNHESIDKADPRREARMAACTKAQLVLEGMRHELTRRDAGARAVAYVDDRLPTPSPKGGRPRSARVLDELRAILRSGGFTIAEVGEILEGDYLRSEKNVRKREIGQGQQRERIDRGATRHRKRVKERATQVREALRALETPGHQERADTPTVSSSRRRRVERPRSR